eukprot:356055_1
MITQARQQHNDQYLLLMFMISILFQLHHVNSEWIRETVPVHPYANSYFTIPGYYNDRVYLLGGNIQTRQLISFNTLSPEYTDHGAVINIGLYSEGQNYVQKGNILYIAMGDTPALFKFDMANIGLGLQSLGLINGGTGVIAHFGCLAHINNYLIFTYDADVYIYNIDTVTWTNPTNTPSIITARIRHTCQVSDQQYLYIIGGHGWSGPTKSTVEKLYVGDIPNINSYSWSTLTNSLSIDSRDLKSVIHNNIIYIVHGWSTITGYSGKEVMNLIDTSNDNIYDGESMAAQVAYPGLVIAGNYIYAFVGYNVNGEQQSYQYYALPTETLYTDSPSRFPTESPIHPVCTVEELDWDALITDGVSQTSLSLPSILSSWDAATLQFSIDITLDYITRSKYTFVDQYDNDRGITYVIDTEPFLSDGRLLSNPNNCEN